MNENMLIGQTEGIVVSHCKEENHRSVYICHPEDSSPAAETRLRSVYGSRSAWVILGKTPWAWDRNQTDTESPWVSTWHAALSSRKGKGGDGRTIKGAARTVGGLVGLPSGQRTKDLGCNKATDSRDTCKLPRLTSGPVEGSVSENLSKHNQSREDFTPLGVCQEKKGWKLPFRDSETKLIFFRRGDALRNQETGIEVAPCNLC